KKAGVPGIRQSRRQLEEKGRLADARRPRHEDHRTRDQASTQDSVHSWEPGADPTFLGVWGKGDHRTDRSRRAQMDLRAHGGLLGHGAPTPAAGTPSGPLPRRPPAIRAGKHLLDLAHGETLAAGSATP